MHAKVYASCIVSAVVSEHVSLHVRGAKPLPLAAEGMLCKL